jgi:AraC-like DNA-binding protein
VPCFRHRRLLSSADLTVGCVDCDGQDTRRVAAEPVPSPRWIVPLRGRFSFRDSRLRVTLEPGLAVLAQGEYVIRHPDGGDRCLSLAGPLPELAADGPSLRELPVEVWLRLRADPLAAAELVAWHFGPRPASGSPRDRQLARGVDELLRAAPPSARLPLLELARELGVSPFHLCRAFRRARGTSIHQHDSELRLRRALTLVLDGVPLAEVALSCGFASQSHLTHRFRARFGVTPGYLSKDEDWVSNFISSPTTRSRSVASPDSMARATQVCR